ncbi:MAG: RimK family alpha-L-glutamate ligase [Candidatus Nanoarchaeia archaeon]|nr:RimK family alpha-L-glutamate ligase [Candidatus Nanoarchaeia archaeon]
MKLAIISLGGKSSLEIKEYAKEYFEEVDQIDIRKIAVSVSSQGLKVLYENQELKEYDCVYIRGSFKYALIQRAITYALQGGCYLPIDAEAFSYAHDKFLTTIPLEKNKVEFPGTYLCPNTEEAKKLLEKVNYPIIIKIPSGTQGKGVLFADSTESGKSILDALEIFNQPNIIQEYIETNGTDLRVIVGGDKILAAMKRTAGFREVRANIHAGGKGEKIEVSEDIRDLAIRASQAIKADICAIDILQAGIRNYVLEINLSPGLAGISEAVGKRVAEDVAKFLANKTKEYLDKKQAQSGVGIIDIADEKREIITNLKIKEEVIKLPQIITKLTGLLNNEEVIIVTKKGRIIIKRS